MKVAVMYSGGKDSTYAIDYCLSKGWEIAYLLSVKPNRKDCFLFHYATVEHTKTQAEILGLKHILVPCTVADPVQEAEIVKAVIEKNPVDAVVLGGTGLQETQIRSIQNALRPLHIDAFAAHAGTGQDHEEVFREMIAKGYEILITQIASDGLLKWLGQRITKENFEQLRADSIKYGFHIGGEGGYFDSFVCDGPIFSQKIELGEVKKVVEDQYNGHLEVLSLKVMKKVEILK